MSVHVDGVRLDTTAGNTRPPSAGHVMPPQDIPVASPQERGVARPLRWRLRGSRIRPVAVLWLSQIALGLMIAGTATMLILQLRTIALQDADHDLRNMALILADQADRAFEAVDLVQTTFFETVQAEGIKTPEDFRERLSSRTVNQALDAHGSALTQLDVIGLADADGKIVNLSRHWPVPSIDVSGQPYFSVLKADPSITKFVNDPLQNRVTNSDVIVLAHRVAGPDGKFLGISVAGVLISYFEKLYQTVADRPEMSIALIRSDGTLLARYPHLDQSAAQAFGRSLAQGGVVGRLAAGGLNSASIQIKSRIDGRERLFAGHTLVHYPMVVAVSATAASVLAPWRRQAADLGGAAVLLELVVAVVGMLMLRQLRGQGMLAEANAARREAEAEVAMVQVRERASREMRAQHVRFAAALGNMAQGVSMFDAAGRLVVLNRRLSEMFALPAAEVVPGMTVDALRTLVAEKSNLRPADSQSLLATLLQLRTDGQRAAQVQEMTDGRTIAVNLTPVPDDGWLVTFEDITERRQVEARIAHMAHHDVLTGLPNRVLFHDRLAEAVARGRRGERSAVLFLNLDQFKPVNDTLGHAVGDALLREVTRRLTGQVRETDTLARLGGDEFAIVQSGIHVPQEVSVFATRIIDIVSRPYELGDHHVTIGASVGIALVPNDGEEPDQILINADLALERAKREGRGRYRFFEAEMDLRVRARRALEQELRKALTSGEFEVFYQPLMNIRNRSICGFEALVRWRHPEKGLVPPSEFIPVAEEIGLIVPLGEWVMRQACFDAATWPGDLKVAVNLSVVQFASETLVQDVAAALSASRLEPKRLELEITETVMLGDTDAVLLILHQLRELGIRIAMDDFGTGYSSLGYLRRFPFHKVKIDRSFVDGIGNGGDGAAIVAAVTTLCTTLGMTTTAEGVETVEQLKQLVSVNCTEAQGYLFSRPRPAGDVPAMCERLSNPESIEWE